VDGPVFGIDQKEVFYSGDSPEYQWYSRALLGQLLETYIGYQENCQHGVGTLLATVGTIEEQYLFTPNRVGSDTLVADILRTTTRLYFSASFPTSTYWYYLDRPTVFI